MPEAPDGTCQDRVVPWARSGGPSARPSPRMTRYLVLIHLRNQGTVDRTDSPPPWSGSRTTRGTTRRTVRPLAVHRSHPREERPRCDTRVRRVAGAGGLSFGPSTPAPDASVPASETSGGSWPKRRAAACLEVPRAPPMAAQDAPLSRARATHSRRSTSTAAASSRIAPSRSSVRLAWMASTLVAREVSAGCLSSASVVTPADGAAPAIDVKLPFLPTGPWIREGSSRRCLRAGALPPGRQEPAGDYPAARARLGNRSLRTPPCRAMDSSSPSATAPTDSVMSPVGRL